MSEQLIDSVKNLIYGKITVKIGTKNTSVLAVNIYKKILTLTKPMTLKNHTPTTPNLFATSVSEKTLFGIVTNVNTIFVKVAEMKKWEMSNL